MLLENLRNMNRLKILFKTYDFYCFILQFFIELINDKFSIKFLNTYVNYNKQTLLNLSRRLHRFIKSVIKSSCVNLLIYEQVKSVLLHFRKSKTSLVNYYSFCFPMPQQKTYILIILIPCFVR